MPPPSSFIDIPSYPFTQVVTQAMFNVANEIWFRRITTVPEVIGTYTNAGGTFVPRTSFHYSDGSNYRSANTGAMGRYIGFLLINTYYIKIVKPDGTASDFDFTFEADVKSLDTIVPAIGDLIINDDLEDHLTAIITPVTGVIKGYWYKIPAGEIGAALPDNRSMWHDRYSKYHALDRIALFDVNFNYVTSVNCGLTGTIFPIFAIDFFNNQFYVMNQFEELWKVTPTGVATNTGYFFPTLTPNAMTVSRDGTKLYWSTPNDDGIIHVLDLLTFTPLADFYTIPTFEIFNDNLTMTFNNRPGDMFCLPNGNIVTWWYDDSELKWHIIHISSAGVLLHDHIIPGTYQIDHIAYIKDSNTHVYLWVFNDNFAEYATFSKFELATGISTEVVVKPVYSGGIPSDPTVIEKHGFSNSCTLILVQGTVTPEPPDPPVDAERSGIYFINPTKITGGGTGKHDSYYGDVEKKIPNPTIKTALLGE